MPRVSAPGASLWLPLWASARWLALPQVAARTVEMFIARYHHPIWTKIASVSFVAVGILSLGAGLPLVWASLGFYGAGIGLESIARGTLPLAFFGRAATPR